jgi:hypothetical protein
LAARQTLGADIDLAEAYAWGWDVLGRIEAEMAREADRIRAGASVDEAVAVLDETQWVAGSDAYQAWLQERHDWALEQLHGTHFDIAEPLRTIEVTLARGSTSGAAYYTPPSEDLTRPGRTWWPLGGRERFATWTELTTVFHEGVPGHHLQNGATRVAGDKLSRFAKFSMVSGHGEGWALYAERPAWSSTSASTSTDRFRTARGGASRRPARCCVSVATPNPTGSTPRWCATSAGLPRPSPTSSANGPGWRPATRRGGGPASISCAGTPPPSTSARSASPA